MAVAQAGTGQAREAGDDLFSTEFLRGLEQLEIVARKVFRGRMRGERITRRRGRGLEFSDFRAYQPGDDLRYIDWNVSARLDRMFLKLHAAEEDLSLHVLVDASASMAFGVPPKFDHARRLAAAFAYLGLANLDRVTLGWIGGPGGAGSGALGGRRQVARALDFLRTGAAAGETAFGRTLGHVAASVRGRGLMIVLSDLMTMDDVAGDDLWQGIDALRARGHDVLLMQVLDEDEIAPPIDGAVELLDAESGEALRLTVDHELRDAYQAVLAERLAAIEARCRRDAILYLRLSTAIRVEDVMLRYLRHGAVVR